MEKKKGNQTIQHVEGWHEQHLGQIKWYHSIATMSLLNIGWIRLMRYDVEYNKRLDLPSLNTNWFFEKSIKVLISQVIWKPKVISLTHMSEMLECNNAAFKL